MKKNISKYVIFGLLCLFNFCELSGDGLRCHDPLLPGHIKCIEDGTNDCFQTEDYSCPTYSVEYIPYLDG